MEKQTIKRKVLFNKPGGTASKNAMMARITLPPEFIKALGITPDNKEVTLTLKDNQIIIQKS